MSDLTPEQEAQILFDVLGKLEDGVLKTMITRALQVFQARVLRDDLDGPGNDNEIVQFFHCGECLRELKAQQYSVSPESYSRLSVGFTRKGIQVWCHRHDINVMHMDLEAVQHPANMTAKTATTGGKYDA
jgi:hypothetical protein